MGEQEMDGYKAEEHSIKCYTQDVYDKYTDNDLGASLRQSGGNYGGGSETLVCFRIKVQSERCARETIKE